MRVGDQDVIFRDALNLVSAYARDYAATILYYDFDGRAEGAVKPANGVRLSDLGRMTMINADLNGDDAAALLSLRLPWSSVAETARLQDADPDEPDGLYAAMTSMWFDVRGLRGIGQTKASKLLHIKRPFAFPLLDRDVRKTYQGRYAASEEFWRELRTDLIDGADDLERIATELRAHDDANRRRAGRLPHLRLLDVLAWKLQHP